MLLLLIVLVGDVLLILLLLSLKKTHYITQNLFSQPVRNERTNLGKLNTNLLPIGKLTEKF